MNDLATFFGGGFDSNSVAPTTDFEVLPPGKYIVMVEKAEVKQTKKGDGHCVKLTLSIIDGPAKNRKLWDYINIDNPSQQAVDIGLRQLAALGQAIGLQSISDTSQLIDKVCVASVRVRNETNEIRTYSSVNATEVAATVSSAPTPLQPPESATLPTTQAQPTYQPTISSAGTQARPPWAR